MRVRDGVLHVSALTIRAASGADLPAIEAVLVRSGLPFDGVADIIHRAPADFAVAQSGDEVVGVAGFERCGDDALLRSVAVDGAWRSTGVGRELVRHVIDAAESRGINALYLLTQTAEHYFPRFGFEGVDRSSVPAGIAATDEFRTMCPASATVMRRSCCTH
jgi:amino-acid N-acetyltransferase